MTSERHVALVVGARGAIGGNLVDVSPVSTIGALCLAAASLIASTLRSDDTRQAPTSNRR